MKHIERLVKTDDSILGSLLDLYHVTKKHLSILLKGQSLQDFIEIEVYLIKVVLLAVLMNFYLLDQLVVLSGQKQVTLLQDIGSFDFFFVLLHLKEISVLYTLDLLIMVFLNLFYLRVWTTGTCLSVVICGDCILSPFFAVALLVIWGNMNDLVYISIIASEYIVALL